MIMEKAKVYFTDMRTGSGEIKNNFFILFEKVGNAHSMRLSLLLAIA